MSQRERDQVAQADEIEWDLQRDMRERGRRLRELAKATEGKELREVHPGIWRYVTVHHDRSLIDPGKFTGLVIEA